jgi:hypothetical protein
MNQSVDQVKAITFSHVESAQSDCFSLGCFQSTEVCAET